MKKYLSALALSFLISASAFAAIDLNEFEKLLNAGVTGSVHGASEGSSLFVFTYRDPQNFFDHAEFPMITQDANILALLQKLKRHDQVVIKGKYAQVNAPQKHIEVTDLQVAKPYENPAAAPPFEVSQAVKDEVTSVKEQTFRVHAIAEGGKVLVVDYKDLVLPVYVVKASETKDLFRGDKIHFGYAAKVQNGRPIHLFMKGSVTVLERIAADHEQEKTLTGNLVYFPKSPQINFDVFALQPADADGTPVQYTLVNFDDPKVFEAIRKKLDQIWQDHKDSASPARNRWINTNIKIQAKGVINVVDPGQANPQILLSGPDDITVL